MYAEEQVCEGSEDDDHQQERHPHRIMDVFLGCFKIFTKETSVGWIILFLDNIFN